MDYTITRVFCVKNKNFFVKNWLVEDVFKNVTFMDVIFLSFVIKHTTIGRKIPINMFVEVLSTTKEMTPLTLPIQKHGVYPGL